jgi:hypothetical protein
MKSLITAGLLVASLALTGNAAMAANTATHKYVSRHTPAVARVAQHLPRDQFGAGLGQFIQSMFGGGLPVRYARSSRSYPSSAASGESFDSPAAVDTSSNDEQAASDAQVQAQQSLDNENALNASTAAAEAQNEAAQAAAIQTEINANN